MASDVFDMCAVINAEGFAVERKKPLFVVVVVTMTCLRASPAAIGRCGALVPMQLEGQIVVGKPRSSHPVDMPSGTVAVVRKPCWSYDVTTLKPDPEHNAAADTDGDAVDGADGDVAC